jgi:hypothetical protein
MHPRSIDTRLANPVAPMFSESIPMCSLGECKIGFVLVRGLEQFERWIYTQGPNMQPVQDPMRRKCPFESDDAPFACRSGVLRHRAGYCSRLPACSLQILRYLPVWCWTMRHEGDSAQLVRVQTFPAVTSNPNDQNRRRDTGAFSSLCLVSLILTGRTNELPNLSPGGS